MQLKFDLEKGHVPIRNYFMTGEKCASTTVVVGKVSEL